MPIVERHDFYVLLRELSNYFYGDEGKGGIWGPSLEQYDQNKPKSWPQAKTILIEDGLPVNRFGWERILERNYLSAPTEKEQDERLGFISDDDDFISGFGDAESDFL